MPGRATPSPDVGELRRHLERAYALNVTRMAELDAGVFAIEHDGDQPWVARVFPAGRRVAEAHGDTEVLGLLADHDYPAERVAAAEPVTVMDGRAVLVTGYVHPVARKARRDAVVAAGGLRTLGALLAVLHTLPTSSPAARRPGGAWHHLADGAPADELAAARGGLAEAKATLGRGDTTAQRSLTAALERVDDGHELPEALIHADFVMANTVAASSGGLVVVDWAGAGRGPRAWSLAFLLFSVGFGGDLARVDRVVQGYRRHAELDDDELARLPGLVLARPVVFEAWACATGRKTFAQAAHGLPELTRRAQAVAERARTAFAAR